MLKTLVSAAVLLVAGLVSASSYDAGLSKRVIYYASAAYCKESTIPGWNCGAACKNQPGVTHVTTVGNSGAGTFSYVGYNSIHNEIVVSFRGSQNIENWISNIDFVKEQLSGAPSGVQVHTGFYKSYLTMQSGVINAV